MAARRMLCLLMALRAEAALYVLDPTDWAADLGEDLDWATANAPFVRLPGYPSIERVFYYRSSSAASSTRSRARRAPRRPSRA